MLRLQVACVAALEETRSGGAFPFDVMNALKPLIANEIISVTRKGHGRLYQGRLRITLVLSNADVPLAY